MSKAIDSALPLGNIETAWDGQRLIVVIDCSNDRIADAPKSSSGKSYLVASTHGSQQIVLPGGSRARLQVNLTVPPDVQNTAILADHLHKKYSFSKSFGTRSAGVNAASEAAQKLQKQRPNPAGRGRGPSPKPGPSSAKARDAAPEAGQPRSSRSQAEPSADLPAKARPRKKRAAAR